MDKFLPKFLSSNADQEEDNQQQEQMSDEPPVTRSKSSNLTVPLTRHQAQLQARRSPSPSPTSDNRFSFPPSTMPDLTVEDIIKVATASAEAAARTLAAAATTAAAGTAATSATSSNNHIKKVELPTFDKTNIHTWIRRVEAAFGRAGVTLPQDKFFFIESKIDVNLNPKVNEFLCGDSTEEKWDEFLEYLQSEYGRSKEQQASLFLRGIPREGLRPSQHLAKIRDLTKDVTLEDLIKEMVLRDLPPSIRQSLAERTDLSPDDAAKAADCYFDKEGNLKHKSPATTVNVVADSTASADTEDETEAVNAVSRGKPRNDRPYRGPNRQPTPTPKSFTPAYSQGFRGRNSYGSRHQSRPQNTSTTQRICKYHTEFRDRAINCEPGCQWGKQNNFSSGNGTAGRRK